MTTSPKPRRNSARRNLASDALTRQRAGNGRGRQHGDQAEIQLPATEVTDEAGRAVDGNHRKRRPDGCAHVETGEGDQRRHHQEAAAHAEKPVTSPTPAPARTRRHRSRRAGDACGSGAGIPALAEQHPDADDQHQDRKGAHDDGSPRPAPVSFAPRNAVTTPRDRRAGGDLALHLASAMVGVAGDEARGTDHRERRAHGCRRRERA